MNHTRKTKAQFIDELKIRDALDRALAMQESDEISEVAAVLFDEFHHLGESFGAGGCWFVL